MMIFNNPTRASVSLISKRFYPHLRTLSSSATTTSTKANQAPPNTSKAPRKDDSDNKGKSKASRPPQEAANSKPSTVLTAPRELPTRHSRHSKPAVPPKDILSEEHQRLLDAPPGTLFGTLVDI
jgi:hypothetical protein